MKKILFMDGFDLVMDEKTQSVEIFSTKLPKGLAELIGRTYMPNDVIDNVVTIYNKSGIVDVDGYLLDEGKITQDEREIIIESIWKFENC